MEFTFESIKIAMKNRLSLLSYWRRTLYFSVYERIIDVVAYFINKAVYLIDYRYRESIWKLAQNRESLMYMSDFNSYKAYRNIGASGNIKVTADENQVFYNIVALDSGTKKISIAGDKTTEFSGKTLLSIEESSENDGLYTIDTVVYNSPNTEITVVQSIDDTTIDGEVLIYQYTGESVILYRWTEMTNDNKDKNVYSTEEKIYYKNTVGSLAVPVKEGIPKEYIYVALGITNEIITIYSEKIDNDEIEVFKVDADGNILETINICGENDNPEELYFVNDLDNYYCEIYNAYDFTAVNFKFGDGINSKKLNVGDRILIKYAETEGENGNIQNIGIITTIKSTLTDANGNEVILYVTNKEAIGDGNNIEDIESIRHNGRNLFGAGYRACADKDWITILKRHPLIYKVLIWTKAELGEVVLDEDQSKNYITAISTDGTPLTTTQQNIITAYLKEQKAMTDIIVWQPLNVVYGAFKVDGVISNQPKDIVGGLIRTTLNNNYGILNTDFKVNIYNSNFINIIDDIEEIIRHDTEIYNMEKDLQAIVSSQTILVSFTSSEEANVEKQIYLVPDTFEIWIKRKISGVWQDVLQIGHDNGGVFVGDNGYTINDGTLDYINNQFSFTIQDIVSDPSGFGVQNPDDTQDTGYIISVLYKTKDGNGNQQNSIRLPKFDFITDIDTEYVFYELRYE